ncbi:MAG: hypothetical protein IK143_02645 [Bacteroidales bacterium]|nr:hypothetical protein [Bacteroidales bacterium]
MILLTVLTDDFVTGVPKRLLESTVNCAGVGTDEVANPMKPARRVNVKVLLIDKEPEGLKQ